MDEWDDSPATAFGGGFGRGRGLGKPAAAPAVGNFGSGNGFSNDNDGFNKEYNNNSIGSRKFGGFGSRGGGDAEDSGFGRRPGFGSRNDDNPRGGGFGSQNEIGGGGGGGCYKCGQDGHFARECTEGGSTGRSGGGGGGGCYKCGESGHFARECTNEESSGGSRGGFGKSGGGGGGGCYKCGKDGHMARDCTEAGGSGGGMSGGGCRKCGQEGHFARDCTNESATSSDRPRDPNGPYIPPQENEEEMVEAMQKGINFSNYEKIPVEVTGDRKPDRGISSFDEAGFYDELRRNISEAKYDKPTPIQKWAIPIIMKGVDLMGCAQTGSGKTAAFLLPVLTGMISDGLASSSFSESQTPQTIIVGPTRELVRQIHAEAFKFAKRTVVKTCMVYGGTSVGHQLQQLQQGAHMVVGTPGRLLDFIQRGKIKLEKVKYLILDEADRMLDMGFQPDIRKLVEQFDMPSREERQTLMFSATFPDEVQKLARDFLCPDYCFVAVGRVGDANTDILQTVLDVPSSDKREKLVELLNSRNMERTLVFVELKRNADFLASYLSQSDFPTTSIHGDRLQREREEALRDFKLGKAPILVATSVAARGLDIPGVMHVINYDMPKDIEEYVHRIGRTGRCGNTGKATSFFDKSENADMARSLVKTLQNAQQEVPAWLEEIAESSFGIGFSGGSGSRFGGRDVRSGGRGQREEENTFVGNGGFGAGAYADEEEEWD